MTVIDSARAVRRREDAANTRGEDDFVISIKVLIGACIAAVAITAIIAIASFILSFASLSDLAERSGYPHKLAPLWPSIVDLTIVEATVGVIVLGPLGVGNRKQRWFFWIVLALAAAISIGCNALHGYLPKDAPLDPRLAAAIAAVAPLSLLACAHGAVILLQVLLRFLARLKYRAAQSSTPDMPAAPSPNTSNGATPARRNTTRRPNTVSRTTSRTTPNADRAIHTNGSTAGVDDDPSIPVAARNGFHQPGNDDVLASLDADLTTADAWTDVAKTLVRDGLTKKSVEKTAEVLELWERGEPPTVIAEATKVHRDTVNNITGAAAELLARADVKVRA